MKSICERLVEIAQGCQECAAECKSVGDARAWRATAQLISRVVIDLRGKGG